LGAVLLCHERRACDVTGKADLGRVRIALQQKGLWACASNRRRTRQSQKENPAQNHD
jgi:hypothetical protein